MKINHIKEISKLNSTIEELQKELYSKKTEIHKLQSEFVNGIEHSDVNKRITDHIIKLNEESENELFSAKKTMTKQERDLDKLQQDLEFYKQNDKKQKIRIKQLEMDLESALKKTSMKGITDRLHSGSRVNSPALSSKRSVSVPHRNFSNEKKPFDRKNSSHLSTLSNKGKYSRENSINSDSGYLSRWNRKNSPDVTKVKKNITPQRKLTGTSNSSIKQKTYIFNPSNKTPKNLSINKVNTMNNMDKSNKNRKNLKNLITNEQKFGSSGKKKYEKPWAVNSKTKNQSPLPKVIQNNIGKNSNSKALKGHESSDDDGALIRKLEDLRNKNKNSGYEKGSGGSLNSIAKISNKENTENIDERLNKLQNLLKMAKN